MSFDYDNYWKSLKGQYLEDFVVKWPVIKKYIPTDPNITILDFGCGRGKLISEMLLINPEATYIGVDVSDEALKQARKLFPERRFYKVGDGEKFPIKTGVVDFILAADVIEHVYNTDN